MSIYKNHHKKTEFLDARVQIVLEELERDHPKAKLCIHMAMNKWVMGKTSRGEERGSAGQMFLFLVRQFGCGFTIQDTTVTVHGHSQYGTRKTDEQIVVHGKDLATNCRRALWLAWETWGKWPAFFRGMDKREREVDKRG